MIIEHRSPQDDYNSQHYIDGLALYQPSQAYASCYGGADHHNTKNTQDDHTAEQQEIEMSPDLTTHKKLTQSSAGRSLSLFNRDVRNQPLFPAFLGHRNTDSGRVDINIT